MNWINAIRGSRVVSLNVLFDWLGGDEPAVKLGHAEEHFEVLQVDVRQDPTPFAGFDLAIFPSFASNRPLSSLPCCRIALREASPTKGIPFAGAKGENLMRATREEGLDVESKALISIGRWAILLPLGTRGPVSNTACTGAPEPNADLVH
jgi:hypothetical protein